MRDPKRIKIILEELERCWVDNPDLRLGQIVSVIATRANLRDSFYIEDDNLLEILKLWNAGEYK